MAKTTEPTSWNLNANEPYIPISYQGAVIGYCHPSFAQQMIDTLNEDEKHRKALYLACDDLAKLKDGTAQELVQHYIIHAERPKRGIRAIALLLQERQESLDVTDEEFFKFCDTYRLSREELRNIYNGEEIESSQLSPISRILGISVDDLIEVWQGN